MFAAAVIGDRSIVAYCVESKASVKSIGKPKNDIEEPERAKKPIERRKIVVGKKPKKTWMMLLQQSGSGGL